MENLNEIGRLVHAVVNQDGGVHQLAYAGLSLDRITNVREAFEEVEMVQKGKAEFFGGGNVILRRTSADGRRRISAVLND